VVCQALSLCEAPLLVQSGGPLSEILISLRGREPVSSSAGDIVGGHVARARRVRRLGEVRCGICRCVPEEPRDPCRECQFRGGQRCQQRRHSPHQVGDSWCETRARDIGAEIRSLRLRSSRRWAHLRGCDAIRGSESGEHRLGWRQGGDVGIRTATRPSDRRRLCLRALAGFSSQSGYWNGSITTGSEKRWPVRVTVSQRFSLSRGSATVWSLPPPH
jgi:hypothetical protein